MAKILVVDDSEALRVQLRRDLEQAQYTVIEAKDGQDWSHLRLSQSRT